MNKRITGLVALSLFALGGCDKLFPPKEVPAPEPEFTQPTDLLDVDKAATEAFRNDIKQRFTGVKDTKTIEDYFTSQGFDCSKDPTSPADRACIKVDNKGKCSIMSIIRTQPFTPDGAQIIKGCKVEPAPQ
jgi:hypothetical protein